MSFEAIAKIYEEIGSTGIMVVLFVLFVLDMRRQLNKALAASHSEKEKKKVEFSQAFRTKVKSADKVINILSQLMYKFGADRAFIFEYHNGGHNGVTRADFIKCSNTFEVVNAGVEPRQFTLKDVHIAMFGAWNKPIVENQPIDIPNLEDISNSDANTYAFLKSWGVKASFIRGLYDGSGNPVAFMGIDFTREARSLTQEEKELLKECSLRLAEFLY